MHMSSSRTTSRCDHHDAIFLEKKNLKYEMFPLCELLYFFNGCSGLMAWTSYPEDNTEKYRFEITCTGIEIKARRFNIDLYLFFAPFERYEAVVIQLPRYQRLDPGTWAQRLALSLSVAASPAAR